MKNLSGLSEPFDPSDIEWFVGVTTQDKTKGLAIPFITNRAVMDRLDEVCGIDGWKNEYKTLKDTDMMDGDGTIKGKKFSYLCGISVWSNAREAWITKWDGAEDTDIEALKGGLSSAMKRAAVQFGIGRYLYKLESPWVEIEKKGKSYIIAPNQKFILPDWAMPGGRGYPLADESRQVTVTTTGTAPSQPQGNPQGGQPQGGPAGNLSEKQVNRAFAKAGAANMSKDDVLLWIGKKFGARRVEDLTRQQYDTLCEALDNVKRNLG